MRKALSPLKPQSSPLPSNFRLFATGQAVSIVGDRIGLIALVFLVVHLSRSYAPALGLFYVCRVAPTLAGGLMVGVFVDQFNRRRLMVTCDVARAALLAAVPLVTSLALWTLYPIVVVLYGLTLLFETAGRAALPDVVPKERMTAANSILNGIEQGADLAYALGGALVFLLQLQLPFYIDAVTFLFSALMIWAMKIPSRLSSGAGTLWVSPAGRPNPREVAVRIREGIAYLLGNPFLKWSSVTFAIAPLAGGAVFVLTPLYANHVLAQSPGLAGPLQSGAFRFSVLEVCLGVGALIGSWAVARLARGRPRGKLFGLGVAGCGVAYALLAFTSNLYLASGILVVFGVCNSFFVIAGMTLVQTLTPSEVRGRVIAARITIINAAIAVGSALGGVLLLRVPYSLLWIVLGGTIAASSLFIWLRPEVRGQV